MSEENRVTDQIGATDQIRVYVAGPYRNPDVIGLFGNIRRGLELSVETLLKAGFAVYCPWSDFLFLLIKDIPVKILQANSMGWLKASDAVLVAPNWMDSKGATAELIEATKLGIPIFFTVEGLLEHFGERSSK